LNLYVEELNLSIGEGMDVQREGEGIVEAPGEA
jgi:hypothetical protein